MDLLCTEKIMLDYDNETIYPQQHKQHQQQQQLNHQRQYITDTTTTTTANNSPVAAYYCSSTTSTASSESLSSSAYPWDSTTTKTKQQCDSVGSSSGYNSAMSSANSQTAASTTATTCCINNCNACRSATTTNNNHNKYVENNTKTNVSVDYYVQQQQQQQQQSSQIHARDAIYRSLDFVNHATDDPTFLKNRCLLNALKAEERRPSPNCAYFKTVQKDITPPMRKIVAEWMMEVCAEEKCQEEVVLLALNYMDRFLTTKSVKKTHLQILAATCLMLASKLREPSCRALSAELLVFYTDNSIKKPDLIRWELYVLSRLGWDLSSVTPLDFLGLLLVRLPIRSNKCPDLSVEKVKQHAQAFISLAAKEHYFSIYSASNIAASSIAAALCGLKWHLRTGQNMHYLLNLLADLTNSKEDFIEECMIKLEAIFEDHSRNLQPYFVSNVEAVAAAAAVAQQQQQQQQQQYHQQHKQQQYQHCRSNNNAAIPIPGNMILPDLTQTCKMQDIKF